MSNGKNIRLVIDGATSADLPEKYWVIDLDSNSGYEAPDPYDVLFQVSLDIGPENSKRRDAFECLIATPNRINSSVSKKGVVIIEKYTHVLFCRKLKDIVRCCEADSWYMSLKKLREKFHWEYEGMYSESEIEQLNS